ncbi:hypothetical protein H5410_007755 [Solanum commersonii]|uniref:Uncharacterized protein n=1 Tax=Solanum commersonii TaxID=4109 RepID=A0A9J6ADP1_SOLCO|nr:hypothetical protein H5410_007755 [Solanum commersonii]
MINYANNTSASSSGSGGTLMPNQSSDQEFRRFTTITGASVMMSMVRDRSLLEALMREGVILPDPEIIGVRDANNTEPLNLELTLAPPVSKDYLQTTTRDFLCKINHNNVTSDHILPNHRRNIASSSRSSSDAVSFSLLNQNLNEFRRFKTVTGTSVVMSTSCDKDLLETLMKAGVILPDPRISSQKETLDFMAVCPVQPRTASAEPPNLELSLAPPGSM